MRVLAREITQPFLTLSETNVIIFPPIVGQDREHEAEQRPGQAQGRNQQIERGYQEEGPQTGAGREDGEEEEGGAREGAARQANQGHDSFGKQSY